MPYIKQETRDELDKIIRDLVLKIDDVSYRHNTTASGILNYCIFKICELSHEEKYADYNAMIGMMECCKLELYRRLLAPYEDKKIKENGDVL